MHREIEAMKEAVASDQELALEGVRKVRIVFLYGPCSSHHFI